MALAYRFLALQFVFHGLWLSMKFSLIYGSNGHFTCASSGFVKDNGLRLIVPILFPSRNRMLLAIVFSH